MRIVLFGSNGMLGNYLKSYLSSKYDLLSLTRTDLDISIINKPEILNFLRSKVTKGDVVINASGIIKHREYKLIDLVMINSVFPNILAEFKNEIGCNVIQITTDCVFSGLKGGYIETDEHDPLDEYGKSKSLGENPVLTCIRTSTIGEEKSNKHSLLEWVISNKGETIDGYENHLWNGITGLELAKFIDKIIENSEYWEGVRHVFSPDTVSKYELVKMINDIYNLNITIKKKKTEINCFRNLKSKYPSVIDKSLKDQILELKEYKLS